MRNLLLLSTVVLMAGCTGSKDDNDAMAAAEAWADAYFNGDYHDAASYATAESDRWLRFAASNTTEEDLQLVKGAAQATAEDYFPVADDTLRVVTLHVRNFLKPTIIGDSIELEKEGTFLVTVVKRNAKWLVRMEGLPRSEKQSRD